MAKSDADFIKALKASKPIVDLVARVLRERGYNITVPEIKYRPSHDRRMEYRDAGDIILHKNGRDLRIEVKQRMINFTCAQDFPFSTVSFDEVYKINDIPPDRLAGYVIVNRAETHMAIIDPATRDEWVAEWRYDPTHEEERHFINCPKELVKFMKL